MNRRPIVLIAAAFLAALLAVLGAPLTSGASAAGPPVVRAGSADLIDPGVVGPQPVDELHYDLGDLAFQPEGFPGRVELAGEVYTPHSIDGRAPVVVLLHGRHVTCASRHDADLVWPCPAALPAVPSYLGYATLAKNLASHGVVVVSIGANGINAADGFAADGGASARAQLVLEHLRRLRSWDSGTGTGAPVGFDRFTHHLDLDDIGLMGHSRGGEGVVAAAQLNQHIGSPFGIRAVLALAPVDFDRRVLGGVALGVVLPYCDGDVSDLQGTSYFDDSRYANPGDPAPKMTALLYGANHNFFNSVWTKGPGSGDDTEYLDGNDGGGGAPAADDPCAAGSPHRLSAAVQNQAGAALVGGFLRRYLQPEPGLQRFVTGTAPFPASVGAARWSVAYQAPVRLDVARFDSPDQVRLNRFAQLTTVGATTTGVVCNASQASWDSGEVAKGVSTTACPGVDAAPTTNDTGALDVGWLGRAAVVREPLATAGTDVTGYDGIRLRAAVTADSRNDARDRQDLSIVLEDVLGKRTAVSLAGRTNALDRPNSGMVQHAVFNGIRVPLSSFGGIDLQRVRAVELRFDRTSAGQVSVADLAFTREDTDVAVGPSEGSTVLPLPHGGCRRSAADRWACAVAQVAWGRDPRDDERVLLASAYKTRTTRADMVRAVVGNDESRQVRLLRFAQPYAQTDIDAAGIADHLPGEGLPRSWEDDIALLTGSFAYSSGRLATTPLVIDAAYQTLLGRSAGRAAQALWHDQVEARGPDPLGRALLRTTTYRGRIVDDRFRQILGRAPSAAERSTWVAKLAARDGEQTMVTTLVASEGFRQASTR